MSNSVLREAGFDGKNSLAIIHIVIAGLSEAQCDQIVGLDISKFQELKLDYDYGMYEIDSATVGGNITLTPELFATYDLNVSVIMK